MQLPAEKLAKRTLGPIRCGAHRHKTFEFSQDNSQLKHMSLRKGELKIFSTYSYLRYRMYNDHI
jgi:hypothetical protein